MWSIGAIAKAADVSVSTVRHYERLGLLTQVKRSEGGQRRYGQEVLSKLYFIRHARALGFSLDHIAILLSIFAAPEGSCAQAQRLAREQLQLLKKRLEELQVLADELERIAQACENDSGRAGECAFLTALSARKS